MFAIFSVLSLSLDLCYHNNGVGECPNGSIGISSVDDISSHISISDKSVTVTVINTQDTALKCKSNLNIQIPITFVGLNDAYLEYTVYSASTDLADLRLSNLNVNIKTNGNKITFNKLTLKKVAFTFTSTNEVLYATSLTSDLYSMQYFDAVQPNAIYVDFSNRGDMDKLSTIQIFAGATDITFVEPTSKTQVYIKDRDVKLTYGNKVKPFLIIKYLETAIQLNLHATLYNFDMAVECDEIFDHISFDATIKGNAKLTLGANTAKLFTEKTITVKGGSVAFQDSDYQANLVFESGKYSLIEVPSDIHFNSIIIKQHSLNIKSPLAAMIKADSITIDGDCDLDVDREVRFVGQEMTLIGAAKINCDNITFENYERIKASSETSVLSSLTAHDVNIEIPLVINSTGPYIVFDKFHVTTAIISLYHDAVATETERDWDEIVNDVVELIHASDMTTISQNIVTIRDSADPWKESSKLFPKERVVFIERIQNNVIVFTILANPANTYKTYLYTNVDVPEATELVVSKTNHWYEGNNFDPYTKGVRFLVHTSMPEDDVVDFSKVKGNGIILSAFFVQSDYANHETTPNIFINIDTLDGICNDFSFKNVAVNFNSSTLGKTVQIDRLAAYGNTVFISRLFRISCPSITLQDTVVKNYEIFRGDKISVIPTGTDIKLTTGENKWTITNLNENTDVDIYVDIDLTLLMTSSNINLQLAVEETAQSVKTFNVQFTSYGKVYVAKEFENFKSLPPIVLSSSASDLLMIINGSYVPIAFGKIEKVTINSESTDLETSFPDHTFFNGNNFQLTIPESSGIKSINMGNLKINDPIVSESASFVSNPIIKFNSVRVSVPKLIDLTNVITNELIVDETVKVNLKDSTVENIRIQGDIGRSTFPTVYLLNSSINSAEIEIERKSVEKLLDMSRMIFSVYNNFNLQTIAENISLSDKYLTVAGKDYYLSLSISNDAAFVQLNDAPIPPTYTPGPNSTETVIVPLPSATESPDEKGGLNIGAVVGGSVGILVVLIVIVSVVIYYRSVPKEQLDSDILTQSNDYLLNTAL
ncbi:hypothetical protein TVAG_481270 [Trichomonas vaginalis G3]|uniref:Surface antigen BspA-like n=1 Tax=Trichomonas vaginalis (strain ATCC PRA-98 / G3) TaxID=412133 RepID=A2F202_TRIV3|nr:hypothetical protein TVAGG3_0477440 [Trichomonas vaginalis G3]EAY01057.1 hypothetical protein TVAG_481270 [Trichomonas vaginalis G3]KAI5515504.1 hypothetical protein TVAGG3_0477440 [Trichomonas vaginalis G3]|eukprot:XP_001313929.1 hypothetical protein [Trichomonas vaginalis G3]